jgi:Aspartyl protease
MRRDKWRRALRARKRRSLARALALFILLVFPLPNPAHSGIVRIPFRTVQSLILFDGKVNGSPATFLLDTGANRTIISARTYANARFDLQRMPPRRGAAGFSGYSLRRSADVSIASNTWIAQQVSVMDLDELQQMLHIDFDALLGQDFLRQFRSVRIDYRTHAIELQE